MGRSPSGARHLRAEDLQWQADVRGASFWSIALDRVSLTRFRVEPHARFAKHSHASEQITLVLSGRLVFELPDGVHEVGPGEAMAVPGHVEHAVYARDEPVDAVDAWSPPPDHLGAGARG